MFIYGGYLAIVYALVPESTTATADDELTEIGYYVICPEILDSALSAEAPRNGAGRPID